MGPLLDAGVPEKTHADVAMDLKWENLLVGSTKLTFMNRTSA